MKRRTIVLLIIHVKPNYVVVIRCIAFAISANAIDGTSFDLYLWSLKIKYDYFQNIDIPGSEPEFFLVTVGSVGMLDHLLVN